MSHIKSTDSKQELFIRRLTHSLGFRYRLHPKEMPGRPDLAFPKLKKVIFVNGCFWHGHDACKRGGMPSTNTEFWRHKISENKNRDLKCHTKIKELGWKYLVLWQCEIKESNKDILKEKITSFLESE